MISRGREVQGEKKKEERDWEEFLTVRAFVIDFHVTFHITHCSRSIRSIKMWLRFYLKTLGLIKLILIFTH